MGWTAGDLTPLGRGLDADRDMSLLANYRPRTAVEMLDASFQMYRAHSRMCRVARRSADRVTWRGHAGHVFKALALAVFIFLVWLIGAGFVTGRVTGLVGAGDRMTDFLADTAFMLVLPIVAITTTLLYPDLRIRREGADVDMLVDALPATSTGV